MKLLREVPIDQRPPELAQLAEPAQQLEVVLERLAEADPGIEPDPLLRDPAATAASSRSARNALTSSTTSS